jgi:hypothetical protein
MSLHRLLFDAAAPDESANVGAHIRAGDDGTLIGHVSDALKVNLSNTSIAVTATDLDIRDLAFATDKVDVSGSSNVAVTDGGGSLTVDANNLDIRDLAFATDKVDVSGSSVTVSGTVGVTQSTSPWVVSATDLDIRDLAFATDKVDVSGSSNVAVTDGGGSLTVDAVNLDIRDLTAASDSVKSYLADGAGTNLTSTLVSGKQALDVNLVNTLTVSDVDNVAMATESKTITTTSGAAIASVLSARKDVKLYNNGTKIIYIGPSGVATSDGFPLPPGSILEAEIGPAVAIHAVAQAGSQDLRVLQMS